RGARIGRRPRARRLHVVPRRARRAAGGLQGARRDRDRPRGDECGYDAARVFALALAGEVSAVEARSFEAHMLHEFARMSLDDGLVMQLHLGSFRDHNAPLAARFGRDLGADIPVATDWTRGLRPLLEACGNDARATLILFTVDESTY